MVMLIHDPYVGLLPVSYEVIRWQVETLLSIGRSYHYRSVIFNSIQNAEVGTRKNGMAQLLNTTYLHFVIDWCKIFGANNNEIHWKKLYVKDTILDGIGQKGRVGFEQRVRRAILHYANITQEEYNASFDQMKNARDRYAAHVNPREIPQMPALESPYRIANALTVLFCGLVGNEFRALESYRAEFVAEISELVGNQ